MLNYLHQVIIAFMVSPSASLTVSIPSWTIYKQFFKRYIISFMPIGWMPVTKFNFKVFDENNILIKYNRNIISFLSYLLNYFGVLAKYWHLRISVTTWHVKIPTTRWRHTRKLLNKPPFKVFIHITWSLTEIYIVTVSKQLNLNLFTMRKTSIFWSSSRFLNCLLDRVVS